VPEPQGKTELSARTTKQSYIAVLEKKRKHEGLNSKSAIKAVAAAPLAALLRVCHNGLNYGGGEAVSDSGEIGAPRFDLDKSGRAGDFLVFDVGAHDGAYLEAALHMVDGRLRAFSFEPKDACVEILRARFESDPRVSLHKTAMGKHGRRRGAFLCQAGGKLRLALPSK